MITARRMSWIRVSPLLSALLLGLLLGAGDGLVTAAQPAAVKAWQTVYRGSLVPQKEEEGNDPQPFTLQAVVSNNAPIHWTLNWVLKESGRPQWPWPSQFGAVDWQHGRAFDAMQGQLSSYGEFLKIEVEGDVNYLFNPLVFGEEDLALSEERYFNNMPTGYKNIMFKKEDVDKKVLFKSKLGGAFLYCNNEFVRVFNDHNLTGIQFTLIPDYNYKEEF